jgi:hypothetical protein
MGFTGLGDSHSTLERAGLLLEVETQDPQNKNYALVRRTGKRIAALAYSLVNCLPIKNDVITIHCHVPTKTSFVIPATS